LLTRPEFGVLPGGGRIGARRTEGAPEGDTVDHDGRGVEKIKVL
jgi:hypothetical protein